jgi:hypothetical protein
VTSSSWVRNANGDWNTGSLWSGGTVPNSASADVTIDATATLVPYIVTIASGETETVHSLSMNAVNNFAGADFPFSYVAAELELDGTLIFAAGSAGTLAGSGQTLVHVAAGKKAAILNSGTLNAFFQVAGTLLLTGTNSVYISNEIQALAGTVTINAPIAEFGAGTLFDGYFDAHGSGSVINLGGAAANQILSIATLEGPSFGWTELSLNGVTAAINEWNGTANAPVETTLTTIGDGSTLDVLGGRNYTTSNSLTIDETIGSSVLGSMLNLQAGTVSIDGGIDINHGVVQGYATIVNNVVNNSTMIALGGTAGGTLDVIGSLTGTGSVKFDLNAATGGADPTPATLVLNSVSAGQTITLNDANDILVLATPSAFAGTIAAVTGGQIVLNGLTATSAVLTNGSLVVSSGTHVVASLALAGSYTGDNFTATGSVVTIGSPVAPSITGTAGGQAISDQQTIAPFASVVIADRAFQALETITVTLSAPANGTLTNLGGGTYNATTGVYTNSGTASAMTAALDGLVFLPTQRQVAPGGTVATGFTITDVDTFSQTTSNSTTTVIATTAATAPTITGALGGQVINGAGTIAPFANVVIGDANFGQTETVTVTLSSAASGTLTPLPGTGTYSAGTGVYTVVGSASFVTSALNGLVFTPTVTPDQSVTTDFAIFDTDTASQTARNATTSVTANFPAVPPTITAGTAAQATTDLTTITPFAGAAIADANIGQTETLTVTLSSAANGTLTNLGGGSYNAVTGVYTDIGTAGAVSTALAGLVFTPTAHQVAPGSTVTTRFVITDTDTASQAAISATATVIATAGSVAPTILHTLAGQAISDRGTIAPFAQVVIGDANLGQAETVTVTLSAAANGTLINLGTGSYNQATGIYTVSGAAAAVSAALNGLVFVPTPSEIAPGGTVFTRFTISDTDTVLQTASDSTTTVIATAGTVAPAITGIAAGQTTTDQVAIRPFTNVVIADANFGQTETVTVTLFSAANGTLTPLPGAGTYSAGVYTVIGSASAVTAALEGLVFTPTPHQVAPGGSVTTNFSILDTDTASRSASDNTTAVTATAVAVSPMINGTRAAQQTTDQGTIAPFGTVAIADANFGQTETVTVTLSQAANGVLNSPGNIGSYNSSTGVYTAVGTAGAVTAALDALIFTPAPNQVAPGTTITTTFTIRDTDTSSQTVTDNTTSVITTAVAVSPAITGTRAGQAITDQTTITPFGTVTIADANFGQTETVTVTLSTAANGILTNLGVGGSYNSAIGVYTMIGTASAITAALNGLVFIPTQHQVTPGATVTTNFAVHDTDTASRTANDTATSVVTTAVAVWPTISGTAATQATTDQATIAPFARVAIADANFGQTETVTVSLSTTLNGTLTNLGGGNYNAATGVYTDIGTADAVTTALNGLVFTPTLRQVAPGGPVATTFIIHDTDTALKTATDSTTSVIATAGTVTPVISGTVAGQRITDTGTILPFGFVSIADANFGQTETVTVTLSPLANGTLIGLVGGGSYNAATGVYTDIGTAGAVTAALQGLVFAPAPYQIAAGGTIATTFAIRDIDTASQTATNSTTTVIVTASTVTPTITGTTAGQRMTDMASVAPFAHVVIADANFGQTETVTVSLSIAANGSLTNLSGGSYNASTGVYTDIGTPGAVTVALNALRFVPAQAEVAGGQAVTTWFTIRSTDTASLTVTDAVSSVTATAVTAPPGEVILSGPSSQYSVSDDGGSLYVQGIVAGTNGAHILPNITVMAFTDGVGVFDPTGTAEDVARLYLAALDRPPDLAGLEFWTAAVDGSNVPLSALASAFAGSPEFIQDYGSLTDARYAQQLYLNVLDRPPDASGLQFWTNVLASGVSRGDVLNDFAVSFEFQFDTLSIAGDTTNAEAYRLYAAALNRIPDPAGEAFWSAQLAGGVAPVQVAQSFINSPEFQQDYGVLTISDFVNAMYENVLHRPADLAGLNFWEDTIEQGASDASVVLAFSDCIENRVQTAGATHANWVFIPS